MRTGLVTRARVLITGAAVVPIVVGAIGTSAPVHAAAAKGTTRVISSAGTARFGAGGADTSNVGSQSFEIPSGSGDGANGPDRSHTAGGGGASVGSITQPKNVTKTSPGLIKSFDGLDHFDERFGSDPHGNQFSLEPPDQGLCVGSDGTNTRIVEAINDVIRVYDTSGNGITAPTAFNAFLGYAPSIVRGAGPNGTPIFGPFVTDPSCLYDAATQRWFVDVLTIDTFPTEGADGFDHDKGTNHIDLAVSQTQDPTGNWNFYRIPVQDDGTDNTPNHGCKPGPVGPDQQPTNPTACFGDYPHIGADANGIYITTNEYSFFGPEFHGAQIYAFSKSQLAAGAATINMTQFDTHAMDTFGFALNGFTLWPSVTPGGGGDATSGGTEYFLSSNAAAEAHDTGDGKSKPQASNQLLTWALTNTGSLASTPALSLSNTEVNVGVYAPPPAANQKSGNQPLRDCLNNNTCNNILNGGKDPFSEKSASLDSNDTRMQQVTWLNGQLWGALDTSLQVSSATQAGIEWFDAAASTSTGSVAASLTNSGYVGLGNDNLTYPAIGLTAGGTGVMAFTLVGSDFYPSAGYATVDSSGVGDIHVAAMGQGPDDGFTDYKLYGVTPGVARPRWGDYGAAVAWGNNIWFASEYIGQSCTFSTYERTNFRCGNTRTALGNWDTRISEVSAP